MGRQICLFYGDEDFLIRERINELKAGVADPALNFESIDGSEPDLERIITALQAQSLLGGTRLVVIRDLDLKLEIWDSLIPHLKNLSVGTQAVFWAAAVSKRSKLYKFIDEAGEVCEFKSFTDWEQAEVVAWIKKKAGSLGKKMKTETAGKLQEICGNSLQKLCSEIEKLATYAGAREDIETEDVLTLASPGEMSIFALSDALAEKNLEIALSSLQILYKNKTDLFRLLALLANQYRTMLYVKSAPNPQKAAQELGLSPYYVRKCLEKAVKFSTEELRRNLGLLLETDLKLKTGEQQLPTLELLLTSFCWQQLLPS